MNRYDYLVDGVVESHSLHASLERLLVNIAHDVRATTSQAPGSVEALAKLLDDRRDDIVKAVLAGTPLVTAHYPAPAHEKPKADEPSKPFPDAEGDDEDPEDEEPDLILAHPPKKARGKRK
jgi:hypothetical protein